MSEQIKLGSCPVCGSKLTGSARFCSECGALVNSTDQAPKVVPQETEDNTWTEAEPDKAESGRKKKKKQKKQKEGRVKNSATLKVSEEALYAKELSAEKVIDAPDPLKNDTVTKARFSLGDLLSAISSKEIINRIVVFIIALALFALAFAPFAFSKVNVGIKNTVKIGFSPKDTVELGVRSLYFLSDNELKKTDIYAEVNDASGMAELMQASFLKKSLFLDVMSNRVEPRITVLLAAVVAVVYIAICALLLLFAFIDLLRELITLKRKKDSKHICSRFSDTLLLALLCLLPFFAFVFTQACDMGIGGVWAQYSGAGVGLAWGGLLTVAVALIGSLLVISKNIISLVSRKEKYFGAARIRNIVCCGLVALVIASAFMPCISLKLNDVEKTDKTVVSVDFNEMTEQSEDDLVVLLNGSVSEGKSELKKQVNNALDDIIFHEAGTGRAMLDTVFTKVNEMDMRALYLAIPIVTAVTLAFACLLMLALITKVFQNAKSGFFIKLLRIVTLLFAGVDLILAVALVISAYNMTSGIFSLMIAPTVGFGAILMVVAAIATLFLRVESKRVRIIDKGYDNADVSYAPYVLDR